MANDYDEIKPLQSEDSEPVLLTFRPLDDKPKLELPRHHVCIHDRIIAEMKLEHQNHENKIND